MDVTKISRVYFIGIGGIGMSAIARYFMGKNIAVSGYDKTATPLTNALSAEGADIHYSDDVMLLDKNADLVIYTPAIPEDHQELKWYQQHDFTIVKRSDVLHELTKNAFNICVAGTHGKTTISTMIAHILRAAGEGCTAFLGGISVNYNSNFWSDEGNTVVVEADEYDRSFLKLDPSIAVITATDADHLDIYGTVEAMREAFVQFASKVKEDGYLLTKFGVMDLELTSINHYRYSLNNSAADIYATDVTIKEGGYEFNVRGPGWSIEDLRLNIGGMHNVENVVAAIAVSKRMGVDNDKLRAAVASFKGVKRRFEYIITPEEAADGNGVVYIDDYAHHPEELRALINSAIRLFNNRKCTVIFQPHLYSRTRDLAKEFAEVLSLADEAILLPIYPARELPIEGVSSELIAKMMGNKNAKVMSKEDLLEYLKNDYHHVENPNFEGQVLITAGAGNIDQLIEPIKEILIKK